MQATESNPNFIRHYIKFTHQNEENEKKNTQQNKLISFHSYVVVVTPNEKSEKHAKER